MSRLDLFLKSRKPSDYVEKVAVSSDFTEEDGSVVLWELKPVSALWSYGRGQAPQGNAESGRVPEAS